MNLSKHRLTGYGVNDYNKPFISWVITFALLKFKEPLLLLFSLQVKFLTILFKLVYLGLYVFSWPVGPVIAAVVARFYLRHKWEKIGIADLLKKGKENG